MLLNSTEVVIDYIVESHYTQISGIKCIGCNAEVFPACDLMLIADVASYSFIKDKLEKMKVTFPYANAAEFFQSVNESEVQVCNVNKKIGELNEIISQDRLQMDRDRMQINNDKIQINQDRMQIDDANVQIVNLNAKINILESDIESTNIKLNTANTQLQAIRCSKSYKIGRGITFLPRKVRDLVKRNSK